MSAKCSGPGKPAREKPTKAAAMRTHVQLTLRADVEQTRPKAQGDREPREDQWCRGDDGLGDGRERRLDLAQLTRRDRPSKRRWVAERPREQREVGLADHRPRRRQGHARVAEEPRPRVQGVVVREDDEQRADRESRDDREGRQDEPLVPPLGRGDGAFGRWSGRHDVHAPLAGPRLGIRLGGSRTLLVRGRGGIAPFGHASASPGDSSGVPALAPTREPAMRRPSCSR